MLMIDVFKILSQNINSVLSEKSQAKCIGTTRKLSKLQIEEWIEVGSFEKAEEMLRNVEKTYDSDDFNAKTFHSISGNRSQSG